MSKKENCTVVIKKCIAEMLGSCLFMLFGLGAIAALKFTHVVLGQWEIGMIWGFAVSFGIYFAISLSGGHLNPVVTIALYCFKGFERRLVLPYIAAQTLGVFLGSAIIYAIYHYFLIDFEQSESIIRNSLSGLKTATIFSIYPHPTLALWQIFIVNFLISTILMAVVFALIDATTKALDTPWLSILIGLLIGLIIAVFGPLGGSMHPACDLGTKLFLFIAGWGSFAFTGWGFFSYIFVAMIGPIAGGVFGAGMYQYCIAANRVDSASS